MALFGEAALIARLENEVTYLRAQLEAGQKREEALRGEVIALADARAKADIERYKNPRKPEAEDEHDERGQLRPRGGSPAAWINALEGDEHIDYGPALDVRRGDDVEDAGQDAEVALTTE